MSLPSYAMNQSSFPEMYERWLAGPLFRPWAELTLEEVELSPGDRFLDIACETGVWRALQGSASVTLDTSSASTSAEVLTADR